MRNKRPAKQQSPETMSTDTARAILDDPHSPSELRSRASRLLSGAECNTPANAPFVYDASLDETVLGFFGRRINFAEEELDPVALKAYQILFCCGELCGHPPTANEDAAVLLEIHGHCASPRIWSRATSGLKHLVKYCGAELSDETRRKIDLTLRGVTEAAAPQQKGTTDDPANA